MFLYLLEFAEAELLDAVENTISIIEPVADQCLPNAFGDVIIDGVPDMTEHGVLSVKWACRCTQSACLLLLNTKKLSTGANLNDCDNCLFDGERVQQRHRIVPLSSIDVGIDTLTP